MQTIPSHQPLSSPLRRTVVGILKVLSLTRWLFVPVAAIAALCAGNYLAIHYLFFDFDSPIPWELKMRAAIFLITFFTVFIGSYFAPRFQGMTALLLALALGIWQWINLGAEYFVYFISPTLLGMVGSVLLVAWWFRPHRTRRASITAALGASVLYLLVVAGMYGLDAQQVHRWKGTYEIDWERFVEIVTPADRPTAHKELRGKSLRLTYNSNSTFDLDSYQGSVKGWQDGLWKFDPQDSSSVEIWISVNTRGLLLWGRAKLDQGILQIELSQPIYGQKTIWLKKL